MVYRFVAVQHMNVSSSFVSRSNQLEVSSGLEEMSKYESAVQEEEELSSSIPISI